jgi:CDP-diacylglycerol--serine O-phosphatidyltransferase
MKKHIPNFLTCCNLLCGCIGIVYVVESRNWQEDKGFDTLLSGFQLILIAVIFDFLDGFAARLLKVKSAIGKDLDSLADMVTFGVLPGMILLKLLIRSVDKPFAGTISMPPGYPISFPLYFLAFLIPVFSALRLAKFNNDPRQTDSFIGLPTPANAMVIASFPLIINQYQGVAFIIDNPWFLSAYIIVSCYLLVSEIRLFSLKLKSFSFRQNRFVYVFLILSVILLAVMQSLAVPVIIGFYIILSIIKNRLTTQKSDNL